MNTSFLQHLEAALESHIYPYITLQSIPDHQKGDICMNIFSLTKRLNKPLQEIAMSIKDVLMTYNNTLTEPIIEDIMIAGGYINIVFTSTYRTYLIKNRQHNNSYLEGKMILLEYSSPNTNKPLHIGHMRNNVLGSSLSNILEACGAVVDRVAVINDRGTHICKSMWMYKNYGNNTTPESENEKPDHFVGRYYSMFASLENDDKSIIDEPQKMLLQWEQGDIDTVNLWRIMNNWVYEGWKMTYTRQGMTFDKWDYESEIYKDGKEIVQYGIDKKVFEVLPDGAVVCNLEAEGYDKKIIQRSDGTSIYITQDLALWSKRAVHKPYDTLICITADEQNYHFDVLYTMLDKLELVRKDRLKHIGYAIIELPEGKMSSRKGTVMNADTLMDELSNNATTLLLQHYSDKSKDDIHTAAEMIMNAAWKFALLMYAPTKKIIYNKDASLSFEGDTGPYVQYTAVRIKSLLDKANTTIDDNNILLTDTEIPLSKVLLEYQNAVLEACKTYNPTYITTYLLRLSQAFNRYYNDVHILKTEDTKLKNTRLWYIQEVYKTLYNGLKLLGIDIPMMM